MKTTTQRPKAIGIFSRAYSPQLSRSRYLPKIKSLILILLAAVTFSLAGCSASGEKTELIMGAASSLTEPLNELSELYASKTGVRPQISFASSGTLRKQAEEGAPFDLLLLASTSDLDALSGAGLLLESSRRDLLSNQICFISTHLEIPASLETLPDLLEASERITLGDPSSVPVGKYAVQSLESLGASKLIEDKKLYAKDARQVLQYLNSGAVDAGFVFATDVALLEIEVSTLILPDHTHQPILYPAALLSDSPEAAAFLEFLSSEDAISVFKSYGFSIPEQK
jgi:molybdate transport system substrate-binding protein